MIGILLISTLGFSVSRHYCMGMLVDESYYAPSDGCGMQMNDHDDTTHDELSTGCCDDENLVFQGIDVISSIKKQVDVPPSLVFSLPCIDLDASLQSPHYSDLSYYPPPIVQPYGRDLLVKVQRFLI